MESPERTATDSGDGELMEKPITMEEAEADAIVALFNALKGADDCRGNDPMLRVCHVCWDKLMQSADALAEAFDEPGKQPPYTMA